MDAATYAVEGDVEATHWWFVGRRRLFARLIAALGLRSDARVLDIGTSTGTNLRLLRDLGFANRQGVDSSDEAIRWCAKKGLGEVSKGDVCNLPFDDDRFDLILATDVIEHVDDDARAVSEIRRVLAPGGYAIVTVPAFRSLWGLQDERAHHKRRYLKRDLVRLLDRCGLQARDAFYFNYLLFAPIWMARQVIRMTGIRLASENEVNTTLLNRVLTGIFALDVSTAPIIHPPFGVSIAAVVQSP
jgi:SAM-dependent methyltransferase